MTAAAVLLAVAVVVRGIPATRPPAPVDRPDGPSVVEPMQLIAGGGERRLEDLDAFIHSSRLVAWSANARVPFQLVGCPKTVPWLQGEPGQRVERLVEALRRGTREEALAALVLVVQVARATSWDPGFFGGPEHAERIGGLLEEWLRVWAEPAATDPMLYQPALAAVLLYGRAMRTAYESKAVGRHAATYERARAFLQTLTGAGSSRRTAFGDALATRFPRAFELLGSNGDFLLGCEEEARVLWPRLRGRCE